MAEIALMTGSTQQPTPSIAARTTVFVMISLTMAGVYYVYDSIGPVASMLSSQLGLTDVQLGLLNAVYSIPNIGLVLVGGILVDRFTARRMGLVTASLCFLGALLTAFGSWFPVMVAGRLLFGVGAETLYVCVFVALAQWFRGRYYAFIFASILSVCFLGSYLVNFSPRFAHSLYDAGWQPPLFLAAGIGSLALIGMSVYFFFDRREAARGRLARADSSGQFEWRTLLSFSGRYWCLVGICVCISAAIAPFRSTFGVKYLQDAHHLSLSDAATLNSYISLGAIVAAPVFGMLADRTGKHAFLLTVGTLALPFSLLLFGTGSVGLATPTFLLGVSFSMLPLLWPMVTLEMKSTQIGTAFGLMSVLQNVGLAGANLVAGYLNDRSGAGAAHPQGYLPMMAFFGSLSVGALVCALWLLRRPRSVGNP